MLELGKSIAVLCGALSMILGSEACKAADQQDFARIEQGGYLTVVGRLRGLSHQARRQTLRRRPADRDAVRQNVSPRISPRTPRPALEAGQTATSSRRSRSGIGQRRRSSLSGDALCVLFQDAGPRYPFHPCLSFHSSSRSAIQSWRTSFHFRSISAPASGSGIGSTCLARNGSPIQPNRPSGIAAPILSKVRCIAAPVTRPKSFLGGDLSHANFRRLFHSRMACPQHHERKGAGARHLVRGRDRAVSENRAQ